MMRINSSTDYKLPLTLEEHFFDLKNQYEKVEELYNLWGFLKKRLIEELNNSRFAFPTFSYHDVSHSRTIIQSIERFLGDDRISHLSATDTFMLLACSYVHDYGMAKSVGRIYEILESEDFEKFINDMNSKKNSLDSDDKWAVETLIKQINHEKEQVPLADLYLAIILVVQTYLRPTHWKGVIDVEDDFKGLFQSNLKKRFISGSEGIIAICKCHGQRFEYVLELSHRADGIIGDEFHPRFIAAMLRLGDLLDLDNGRFPMWFIKELQKNSKAIPHLSKLNYLKHESISHFLITPKRIEVTAKCYSDNYGHEVAYLISDWTEWLCSECKELVLRWNDIAQPDFGRPPSKVDIDIYLDDSKFKAETKDLQMKMSQETVMKLLEGTNIYSDRYVGIREMLQNAVDASLLQLWKDIMQNKYTAYKLWKNSVSSEMDVLDFMQYNRAEIFGNYNIKIEVIKDILNKKVYVVVKDRGTGISPEDIKFISELGTSKEKNQKVKSIIEKMPVWLRPSGFFGIGLQSVFQLTDCIDFYTRSPDNKERKISLYSYGKNKGKIEVREMPPNSDGLYYDNAVPGTNVKIAIDPYKLLSEQRQLLYYDTDFDIGDELDVAFGEIAQACIKKIKETPYDYFNVYFQTMTCNGEKDKNPEKEKEFPLRRSYFYINKYNTNEKYIFGERAQTLLNQHDANKKITPFSFIDRKAYFWDKNTNSFYTWTLRPCKVKTFKKDSTLVNQAFLPEKVSNLYSVKYKFSKLSNVEMIYSRNNRTVDVHAGFLELDILILDHSPVNYLNIDRERLIDGAIDEEDILAIRKTVMEKWCEYFCRRAGSTDIIIKRFSGSPGTLLSLFLLFYQDVPKEQFEEFKCRFQEAIESMNMVLGGENIKVSDLWNENKIFQTTAEIGYELSTYKKREEKQAEIAPEAVDSENKKIEHSNLEPGQETSDEQQSDNNVININVGLVRHLPHRLVNVKSINCDSEHTLIYKFKVKNTEHKLTSIAMDNLARLWDYIATFAIEEDGKWKYNFQSVQKKVFKPDSRYEKLVIPKFPTTFCKGFNFATEMDYCIGAYILSPFDNKSAKILKRSIDKKENRLKESSLLEFKNYVLHESIQLKKCVNYILKIRYNNNTAMEKIIYNEYENFVVGFFNIVFNHLRGASDK